MHTTPVRRISFGVLGLAALALALLPSCRQSELTVVVHQKDEWGTGYEATMTIANEGRSKIDKWTIEFNLPDDGRVTTYWNAGVVQRGNHVTAKSLNYNAKIGRNDSVSFGFTVEGKSLPTNCLINGEPCGRAATTTTAKPKKKPKPKSNSSRHEDAAGRRRGSTTTTTAPDPSSTTTVPDPGTSASTSTTEVPSPVEAPSAKDLLAQLDTCDEISDGSFRTDETAEADVPVCKAPGAVFFTADLDITCDGVPGAECNDNTDPSFQADTSLLGHDHQPLDAATLPYVVLPSPSATFDYRDHGIGPGDVVAVIHDGKVEYAVFGDTGPKDLIGEGSYALADKLGIDPDPLRGGTDGDVTFVVFPGSELRPVDDHELAVSRGLIEARQFLKARSGS